MERLRCMLVVDPSREGAEYLAEQCHRLAHHRQTASTTEEALQSARSSQPEMMLLSLDLPNVESLATQFRTEFPDVFIVATFRELSVPRMETLGAAGVGDFIPQPIDMTQLQRAVSAHFGRLFGGREGPTSSLDVLRGDGVMVGRTRAISESGMSMEAIHPISEGESMLLSLDFPGGSPPPLKVRCRVLRVQGQAPQAVVAHVLFENLQGGDYRRLSSFLNGLAPP